MIMAMGLLLSFALYDSFPVIMFSSNRNNKNCSMWVHHVVWYLIYILKGTFKFFVSDIDSPKLNLSTSITLNETDPLYVRCTVNSNLPATYLWNTASGTVVSNSNMLAFNSVRRNDENSYRCTVTNAAGTKLSEFLNVTVQCTWIIQAVSDKLQSFFIQHSWGNE